MIEAEPKPYRKNAAGTDMLGPAGAAIWSAPTIDPKPADPGRAGRLNVSISVPA